MSFYPRFISLTCGKDCEINLQADIFISIPVLCQRSTQITAFRRRSPSETDTGCQAARGGRGCAESCPVPSHTGSASTHRTGSSNETRRQQQRSECKNVLPRLLPPHQLQKLHEPRERTTEISVNGNFHLRCLTSLSP